MIEAVWEIDTGAGTLATALQAYGAYGAEQKRLHELRGTGEEVDLASLGHPYWQVWTEVARHLQAQGLPDVKKSYGKYWQEVQSLANPEGLMEDVRHVRAKKGKGGERGRISFRFGPLSEDLRDGLVTQLKHEGAHRWGGSRPKGPLEREAANLLSRLNKT